MILDAYIDAQTDRVLEVHMVAKTAGDEILLKAIMDIMQCGQDGDLVQVVINNRVCTWTVINEDRNDS